MNKYKPLIRTVSSRDTEGESGDREGLTLTFHLWRVLSIFGGKGYRGYIAVAVPKQDFRQA
jgi:hypothetical protein